MSATTISKKRTTATPVPAINSTVTILGILTLIGAVVGVWRLVTGLGATTNLSDGYPWGIWIGFDFTLIAFSGSGFTMAALVYIFRQEKYRPVLQPAVLAALLGYTAVLLLLVLDLGRWDRFWAFIVYWNVHSPLFEISWCVLLYTTVLLFENSPSILKRLNREKAAHTIHRFIIVLAVAAVMLSSLHQSTLGTLYLNMPHRLDALWFTPILSLLFFVSSVMAGLAVAMVAYLAANKIKGTKANPALLTGLAKGVAWFTLLYTIIKLVDIFAAGEGARLFAFDRMSWLMLVELGAGAVVPMILFFTPALRAQRTWQWVGITLVLFGVLLNRFSATLFAQSPPAGATYVPHIIEWLSTIGVVAGAALAWYLLIRFISFDKSRPPAQ